MSSSLLSQIKMSQVYDPRCNVSGTMLGGEKSNVKFLINRVSDNIQYFSQSADTTSNGIIAFNNISIDPNQGLSSTLVMATPVRITMRGASGAGTPADLIESDGFAPRSSLFMKNNASINLGLNGTNMNENTYTYMHALAHYGYNYESLVSNYSYLMRSCLDNDWEYGPNNNRNVLAGYDAMPVMTGVTPRGAFQDLFWRFGPGTGGSAGQTLVDGGGNYRQVTVDVLYIDVIPVSPLNISDYPKYCLTGVNSLSLQISMNIEFKYLVSMFTPASGPATITSSTVSTGNTSGCSYGTQAFLYYQLYSIPAELTDGVMPALQNYVYPYYNTNNFVTTQNTSLVPGDQQIFNSNSITPQGVPKYIYCWAEPLDTDRDQTWPYWFLSPKSITVNFLNKQSTLATITAQASLPLNWQLYSLICSKNGYRGTLAEFLRCGVMCLTPEDLNVDPMLLAGMSQQSTLQITYVAQNNSTRTLSGAVFRTCIVYEGAIIYTGAVGGGSFNIYSNIVSPQFLDNAKIESSRYYYIDQANRDYLGGLSFKQLLNSAKGVATSVLKGAKAAAPYVEKYAPMALAALGAGQGGGFVAGQRLSRSYLKDRIK